VLRPFSELRSILNTLRAGVWKDVSTPVQPALHGPARASRVRPRTRSCYRAPGNDLALPFTLVEEWHVPCRGEPAGKRHWPGFL